MDIAWKLEEDTKVLKEKKQIQDSKSEGEKSNDILFQKKLELHQQQRIKGDKMIAEGQRLDKLPHDDLTDDEKYTI